MGNIVKAIIGKNGKEVKTAPLYQYDYGQILKIEGITLPNTYQVHFSNDPTGTSTTSVGNAEGVEIPDVYLTSGDSVYAWLYLHTGEDDGETVLKIEIPVRRRAEITNQTPTPQQQSEIDQLIGELNEAVDAAEDAKAAAEDAADQAEAQVEKYPIIVDGYWAFWDEETEQYVKSNQKAKGDKGDPGDPGDPTTLIDDTSTAANKTWSASKSESEKTAILRDISALDATKIKMDATDQTSQSVSNKFSQIDGSVASVNNALSGKVSEPAQEGTAGSVMTTDGDGHRSWTELANTEADMSVSGTTLVIASRGGGGGDTGTFTQIYSATLAENTASIDVTRKDNNTGDTFTTNKILAMFEIPASTKTSFKVFVPYGSTTDGVFYESLGDATYKFYINVLMEIKCGRLFGCITGSTNQTNRSGNYNTSNNLNGYLEASELTRATFSRGGDGFPTGTKVKVYIAE